MINSKTQDIKPNKPDPTIITTESLSPTDQRRVQETSSSRQQMELVSGHRNAFRFKDNVFEKRIARIPKGYIAFSPQCTDVMLWFKENKLLIETKEPECPQIQTQSLKHRVKRSSWYVTKFMNVCRTVKRWGGLLIGIPKFIVSTVRTNKKSKNQ